MSKEENNQSLHLRSSMVLNFSLYRLDEALDLLESLVGGEDVPEGVKMRLSR